MAIKNDGIAAIQREYDEKGCIAVESYYGVNGEPVRFKVYDGEVERDVRETVEFRVNGLFGGVEKPYVLHASGSSMVLFPNPVERGEAFVLDMPTGSELSGARVEVYNALGSVVRSETVSGSVELSGLPTAGVYTVKVTELNGNVHFAKLVVR